MINRDNLIKEMKEEQKLRTMIRRGIKIVRERKRKEKEQQVIEEQKLRSLVRGMIKASLQVKFKDNHFAHTFWQIGRIP